LKEGLSDPYFNLGYNQNDQLQDPRNLEGENNYCCLQGFDVFNQDIYYSRVADLRNKLVLGIIRQ
jgi:hypothetical protein